MSPLQGDLTKGSLPSPRRRTASSGQFPSMVMFVLDDDVPMCGGSILNARWAFTGRTITNIRVSEPSSRSYTVIKIVPHEKLRRPAHGNDISVVKLDKDIIFNANTKPVKLPYTHAEDPTAGAVLTLPGYGVTSVDGPLAPQMQYVTMKYVSDKECQSLLRAYARSLVIVPAQLCAGGEAGKDGCQTNSRRAKSLSSPNSEKCVAQSAKAFAFTNSALHHWSSVKGRSNSANNRGCEERTAFAIFGK
ncbi:unnamed protein product [Notodromas monacha]|uniref:Peptidase S1 domain-containing protein n=1 Tax=Notodromas monacha TaxID=399045 RepID=A0A7R9BX87_9CRUS|nr:unnamed protein product [Notodromas monacha]CAG0923474.1 unnamed protein product [Notodromas monacha]